MTIPEHYCTDVASAKSRAKDLTGKNFGNLVVAGRAGTASDGSAVWLCTCTCGKTRKVRSCELSDGGTTSCSECTKLRDPRVKNLVGKKFGRLTVISRFGYAPNGRILWMCACTCKKRFTVTGHDLLSGNTKSCGCYKLDALAARVTKHGQTKGRAHSRTYASWSSMITRCTNLNATGWKYWGGRGIKICPEWFSFENFFADNGLRPPGKSLDRIDNEKGYFPGNTRWVPQSIQCQNQGLRSDNKTGAKGVSVHHGYCYRSQITVNRKAKHLGYYPLTEEGFKRAKAVRLLAEDLYFGGAE